MKYIKLFEQFEEDAWWEKESPFDIIKDLELASHSGTIYLVKRISDRRVKLFDDVETYPINIFNFNVKCNDKSIIYICDLNIGIGGESWKYYKYGDLPKEIKDRIKK